MKTNIDLKLPHAVGEIIWNFRPYHDFHTQLLKEMKAHITMEYISRFLDQIQDCNGISIFKFYIKDEEKQYYTPDIYLYIDPEEDIYLETIKNPLLGFLEYNDYKHEMKCLLNEHGSKNVVLELDYEMYYGNFCNYEFSLLECEEIETPCICGNTNRYKLNDIDITIETHASNIFAREASYCC